MGIWRERAEGFRPNENVRQNLEGENARLREKVERLLKVEREVYHTGCSRCGCRPAVQDMSGHCSECQYQISVEKNLKALNISV